MKKLTLRQAVEETVRIEGFAILQSPQRFVGCLADLIDTESFETNILYSHCDERFLGWFADAIQAKDDLPNRLRSAYLGARRFLESEYGISESAAHGVAAGIALGLADAAGVNVTIKPPFSGDGNNSDDHGSSGTRNGTGGKGVSGNTGTIPTPPPPPAPAPAPPPPPSPMWPKVVVACLCVMLVAAIGFVAYLALAGKEPPAPNPWKLIAEEPSLASPSIVSEDYYATDSGEKVMILAVRNGATSTVDLHASFSFLDSKGNVVEQRECDAWSVGPGEETLMEQYSSHSGIEKVTYEVTPSVPKYGKTSISSCVTVEELTCNSSGLTVRVSNTSDRDVALVSCVAYGRGGHDDFSYIPVSYEGAERNLKPGESRNIAFGGSQWRDYDRKVYVYGYAD